MRPDTVTETFDALGFDPAPGDVDTVDTAAGCLRTSSRELAAAAERLWGATEGEWRGATATAFRDLVSDDLRPPVADAADVLADAARHLTAWSSELAELQRRARALEREADQAVADAAAARSDLAGIPSARPPWLPPPSDPGEARRERANARARETAGQALGGAEDRLADCRRRAHDLADEYERGAAAVAEALRKASAATPPSALADVGDGLGDDALPWPYGLALMSPEELSAYAAAHPEHAADVMEYRLRQEGLLDGDEPGGYYREWLENAAERGIDPETIVEIAGEHEIDPDDFAVLDDLEEVTDPDGKSFFLLPDGITADQARLAVLMTYILNAGTDYGSASPDNDFEETPYSAAEIARIIARQDKNSWSYDDDVEFVNGNDGRLVTTPNGMLMGLGGNWLQDRYSLNGGTTWGDTFMVNIDGPSGEDAAQVLRDMVASGRARYEFDDGSIGPGASGLDLDRLLHHEEIHSQQWADLGYARFAAEYLGAGAWEWIRDKTPLPDGHNHFEEDAGLSDGGYH